MVLELSQTLFRRRLIRAIALPIILLLLLSCVSIWQITQLLSALQWVDHTNQVISQAHYTQKLLLDMETGFRGYLLSGNQEFLQPYEQANAEIDSSLQELKNRVSDNPSQVQQVIQLIDRLEQWEQQIPPAIARKQRGEPEPLRDLKRRKQIMDRMRQQIAMFVTIEEQLRSQRNQTAQQTTRSVILSSLFLTVGVGVVIAYFIRGQIVRVSQIYENALHTASVKTEAAQRSAIALQRSAQRLVALHDIDRAILAAETHETLIDTALVQLRQIVPHHQAFVAEFNLEIGTAQILAGSSQSRELYPVKSTQLAIADFAIQQSLLQEIRYIENLTTAEFCPPLLIQLRSRGLRSCLCVPLLVENTLIGELNLASTEPNAFDGEVQEIAREVGAQLAIALQQSRMRSQLQEYAAQLEQRVTQRTAQLEERNQELEAFTYSVSHDLRAPLRTIQGFAQALLEDCSDQLEEFCRSYINSIIDDTIQMNGLIGDLLAYSRLTRTHINLQPTSLNEVVDEALKQLTIQIQEQQAQIRVKLPLPQVLAHRSTLIQVVVNLISNAVKFVESNTQPQIDIFAQEEYQNDKNWIILSIVDNGIGIATEHQERVFRVFERLHGSETYPGTGIGLAIVRKGLERMGGRVGVDSQLGNGSRFWIALPKAVLPLNNS
jgi:signal transduction histidine kinase/CHASE3 domain sensor protein